MMTTSNNKPQFYRTSKGSLICGVCSGLEATGRGNAIGYRILFIVFGIYAIGIIGYFIIALIIPKATLQQEEILLDQIATGELTPSSLDKIKVDLERVQEMKDSGLITDEEYAAMRTKILGI